MTSRAVLLLAAFTFGAAHLASAQAPWRVDAAPVLDLSSSGASGAILFARVTNATRFENGTIVIADNDDKALHYFDATGKPIRTAGRAGAGPGEFKHLSWMGRCSADSLHVWDFQQRRMSVFAPNGAFVRQYSLTSDTTHKKEPFLMLACSPAGVVAFQGQPGRPKVFTPPKDPAHPTRQERAIQTTAAISVSNTVGKVSREFGELPSGAMYMMGGGAFPLPFASTSYLAIAGNRMFIGVADSTSQIVAVSLDPSARGRGEARTLDGAPEIIKLKLPMRPTTVTQRDRAAAATASMAPAQLRQMAEDSLKLSPMPAMLPPFSALFGDSDGVLWVQLTVPGDPNTRLRAIGLKNETLGEITLPANVVIQEIGRDYVLASFDDASDVPHLAMYRLHRGR